MTRFEQVCAELRQSPRRWLVTGAAGFIGSALVESLLEIGQHVVGVDNFLTGHRHNIDDVRRSSRVPDHFEFVEGDICDRELCKRLVSNIDIVLHQAALGSVPRSLATPLATHDNNVNGFLFLLDAIRDSDVRRLVYASSSSVYGDSTELPKREPVIGTPMSPYAASKRVAEIYAGAFGSAYGLSTIGLRYFNVYGRRQDPDGPYAAVIPRWIERLSQGQDCTVYGDGSHSRDFCYVDNVVQANVLAATAASSHSGRIYNVGLGGNTCLTDLFAILKESVTRHRPSAKDADMQFEDTRPGDVPHSQASIDAIKDELGYGPSHDVARGLPLTVDWFLNRESSALQAQS